jgi:hypothetical protein
MSDPVSASAVLWLVSLTTQNKQAYEARFMPCCGNRETKRLILVERCDEGGEWLLFLLSACVEP